MKTYMFLFILISPLSVNAAFIESDWRYDNDNAILYDDSTNLEWLKTSSSSAYSLSSMNNYLQDTGSDYFGYRYATQNEVVNLLEGFLIDSPVSTTSIGRESGDFDNTFSFMAYNMFGYSKDNIIRFIITDSCFSKRI